MGWKGGSENRWYVFLEAHDDILDHSGTAVDRWSGDMDDIAVIVRVGDHAGFGDGSATHVATISLAGDPVAGLRVICTREAGPVRIVGVWSP